MATIINPEKQTISFVGGNQPAVVVPFDKIEKLAVEADADLKQKVGRVYFKKDDGSLSWVAVISPEQTLPNKLKSLAAMVKKALDKDIPVSA